jgi:hypothetical protein
LCGFVSHVAKAEKGISWEEWILRSPFGSGDEAERPRHRTGKLRSEDPNQFGINSFDKLFRAGHVVINEGYEAPVSLRYLEEHMHANVLSSMRQWHPRDRKVPPSVNEAGMLWLQRFLVDRETVRLYGFPPPGYGPLGLYGLVQALGVVCFHCGPTTGSFQYQAGNVYVIAYTRALRRCYRDAGSEQSSATNC